MPTLHEFFDVAGNPVSPPNPYADFGFSGAAQPDLDGLGIIEALTGIFGEELAQVGGWRMTRLTAAVSATDATFYVESTLDWPDAGVVALDGVRYTYASKTLTSLAGIQHVAGGATVAGAIVGHRVQSTVVDLSREWSALDLLRRAFLVDYAEGNDLNALARNLGVNRPPIFTDDDQFRAVVKAVAYNPKGTVYGLELALEALVGAGNYQVYEDLVQFPNTVFIRIDSSVFIEESAAGRAFMANTDWDDISGGNSLTIGETPLAVGGATLYDMNYLFDFRDDIPSDVEMPPWPDETPINPWTYQGSESEGTAVANVPGEYTEFSSSTGSVYYRMSEANGARYYDYSLGQANVLLNIPSTATMSADRSQCALVIEDGDRNIRWGVLDVDVSNYEVGLFNTSGWLGTQVNVSKDEFHEITLVKPSLYGGQVELWVDGKLITQVPRSSFDLSGSRRITFGILVTTAGLDVQYKQLGVYAHTSIDLWNGLMLGTTNTANPTRYVAVAPFFIASDVGKKIQLSDATATNPQGGNNNGTYLVSSLVGAPPTTTAEFIGREFPEAASAVNPDQIVVEDEEAFTYPDDLGKTIVISGSSLGNNGSYTIVALIEPGTLADFADYATPITGAKTNICEVSSAPPFTAESGLTYRVDPVFVTDVSLFVQLSDGGSFSGSTLTLRGTWSNGLVIEVKYSNVPSAQLLKDTSVDNIVDPGPVYEYWPFYLADPLGLVSAYMDDLTAAGVIPEFENL